MAASVGLDPARDIDWVVPPSSSSVTPGARELFADGKVDAYSRAAAARAGATRPRARPRHPEHRDGPALVAVLLLHARRAPRACRTQPGGHQAAPAGDPQVRRPLRRRSRSGPRGSWSSARPRSATTWPWRSWPRCRTPLGASTTPRTRCASTRCACTRSDFIKSNPQAAHRRRHRLALPGRDQARAEDVS